MLTPVEPLLEELLDRRQPRRCAVRAAARRLGDTALPPSAAQSAIGGDGNGESPAAQNDGVIRMVIE